MPALPASLIKFGAACRASHQQTSLRQAGQEELGEEGSWQCGRRGAGGGEVGAVQSEEREDGSAEVLEGVPGAPLRLRQAGGGDPRREVHR